MASHKVILNREEARDLDRHAVEETGIPGIVLMENAGRSIADLLLSLNAKGPVVICCGKGNNAGDGFVLARHLDNHDIPVRVLLFSKSDQFRGEAEINYNIIVNSGLYIVDCSDNRYNERLTNELKDAEWVVDALFGTGLTGTIQSPYDDVINTINASHVNILAIDIPSGLDCDTGKPLGVAIKATHTATLVAFKKGFASPEAKEFLGTLHVLDIGLPKVLLNEFIKK